MFAASPIITASMTDTLENDDGDGKIDPTNGLGSTERIIYSTTITNSGTVDATGVQFTDTIDAHTTFVPASLNVSPLAGDDSYDTIGNTLLEVGPVGTPSTQPKITVGTGGSPKSVFDNDTEFLGDTYTLSKLQAVVYPGSGTVTAASTHGSVTMDGSGHFSYLPTAGYTGDDTFTYEIKDGAGLTGTGTVTIHVNAQRVWYVQNNSAGTNQGTSENPFTTLASAQAVATVAGDIVYVFNGNNTTTNQNAGYTFQANTQRLIGEGVQLDAPVSVNGGPNPTVLRAAGTATKIGNGAGDAVTVTNRSGIIIRGFIISDSANGIAVSNSVAGGGVTISNNSIAGGTGNAIDVTTSATGGGSATITNNVISAAGAEGIDINANGSGTLNLTVDTNTIASTGTGFDVQENGGACNVGFTNNTAINSSAGNGVSMVRVTGTLSVTAFANNQIAGTTANNGVVFNNAIFDSNPATGATDALTAGTLTIGASGATNGVGLSGLVLVNTTGTLPFTTLNIFAENGRGIDAAGSGSATAGLTAGSGATIAATNGASVKVSGLNLDLQSAILSSTNSPDNGVSIGVGSGVTGTFSATSGSSISNAAGDDFAVGSGTANITWNATLNNSNGGNAVDVTGHQGGTVSFTAGITDTVQGINLSTNTGATIAFSGGLDINTGANPAFTATGGGTVTATQNNTSIVNKLQTTTAAALNVANTSIGAAGLTFRSINAGQAGGSAGVGISLNTTGTAGGLTVTGNTSGLCGGTVTGSTPSLSVTAANSADCSGGQIQHKTGSDGSTTNGIGIYLNNTGPVSLTRMWLHDFDNFGIFGSTVPGLTISNSLFNGSNGTNQSGSGEGAAYFFSLTGSASITNSSFSGGAFDSFHLEDVGTDSLNRITFQGDNFGDTLNATSASALFMQADCSSSLKMTVDTSKFTAARSNNLNISIRAQSNDDLIVSNNEFSNSDVNQVSGGSNVAIGAGGPSSGCSNNNLAPTLTYNIHNNTFKDALGTALSISKGGTGTGNFGLNATPGLIDSNTFGVNGVTTSSGAGAIGAIVVGGGQIVTNITNNVIHGAINGINIGANSTVAGGGVGYWKGTITGNSVDDPNVGLGNITVGLQALFGASGLATDAPKVCLTLGGAGALKNNIAGGANGGADIRLRVQDQTSIGVIGYVGANNDNTAMNNFILSQNTVGTGGVNATNNAATGSGWTGSCPAGVASIFNLPQLYPNAAADAVVATAQTANTQFAETFVTADGHVGTLTDSSTVSASETAANTVAAGATIGGEEVATPSLLGRTFGSIAHLAQSVHSFVEPTAYAAENGQKSGVRLNHARNAKTINSSAPAAAAPFSGDTVIFDNGGSGFTLPVGKSVTIVFKATLDNLPNVVNNPYPTGGPQVSNQARIFGTNFTLVNGVSSASPNTDDPAPPAPLSNGTHDATVTYADLFNSTTVVNTNGSPSQQGDPVTFTATVSFNPTGSPAGTPGTPTGSVTFKDGASPITCDEGAGARPLSGGVAVCTTSALSAAAHTINADYGGDGNFDISTGSVAQTVNPCNASPVVTKIADTNDGVCDGDCSLREAIATACTSATITFNTAGVFATPQTITLSLGQLTLARNVTIDAPDPATQHVTISGNNATRVFGLNPGKTATIRDLTITNGLGINGGAVYNDHGTLTLLNLTIGGTAPATANTASLGAGVYNDGATSGSASLTITNSTISGNVANSGDGGGVYNAGAGGSATLTINNSTISGNNATGNGGGVFSDGTGGAAIITTTNATITNNHSDSDDSAAGDGGGLYLSAGTYKLRNTIVAGNFMGTGTPVASDIFGSVDTSANSSNNLIGTGGAGGLTGTNGNLVSVASPGLGPLASNGGPTLTHALLFGSPAIEAGNNTFSDAVSLTNDQRGAGFIRKADSADANTTQTVDIGAFEAQATVAAIPDKSTGEDTPLSFSFDVGDGVAPQITSVTASSSNTTLVPNLNANLNVTGAGSTRTLNITPASNQFGTSTITVTVFAGSESMQTSFTLTVSAVADLPSVTPATTNEDTQTTSGLVITPSASDGGEVTFFKITSITNGSLFQNDGTTPINNGDFITVAQGGAGLKFTPAANFFGNGSFQVAGATDNSGGGLGAAATATITVNPVADTPSITATTTNEDTQSTSGLVISRNAADGAEVTHFKITGITNGTLFQNNGTTQINDGDFITFAQGNAGLKFTPAANLFSPSTSFTFTIQSSTANNDGGLGGSTVNASITVNPVADTPSVTNSSTTEDTQTTTGLVISRNAVDSTEVAFFKITNITNGTLFKNDGTTPISNNQFITFAEGNAGLKFTPAANFNGNGSFQVQGSIDNAGTGLSSGSATATITVGSVGDPPGVTNAQTNEDTQTSSGLVITKNVNDGADITVFKITNITNGTLFQNNGTTPINNGDFITIAQGNAGLKFTPSANLYSPVSTFSFDVAAAQDNTGAGLGNTSTATIVVNPIADTPSVTPNPQTTAISTQTGPMVITRNAADAAEVTHFKITNITNGVLYQNDGTTPINNNDFITFAQGNSGLKFTPTAGLSSPANSFGFDVQASLSNSNGGLGGGTVHEDIVVSCSDPQVVTSILDDGSAGTLRYAIANSCPGTGTITFNLPAGPQTIMLGSTLTITKTLQILGPSNQAVTINGNGNRVLTITGGSPNISNLTFTGALVSGGNGGGLLNTGTGAPNFNGVTFSGNSADNGGAIATTAGNVVLNNSTISGNTATTAGGGIYVNGAAASVALLNDTITNNTATAGQGGGLNQVAGNVFVRNTIIAGNTAPANPSFANVGGTITDQGNNILTGNPQLAALANNGGPTMTHALLSNSPALDAGDNTAAAALVTDQRGNTFGRFRDAANDADTTQTVDIGSFEADPSVEDITDKTTNEDTALPTFSFRVADTFSAFDSIVGTSNNQTIVPDANIVISGSGNTRNIAITPAANQSGTVTITVTVTKTINSTQVSMSDTFQLTVNPIGDTPSVTNATTNEDTQSTSGLVITRNVADGAEIQNFKITGIIGGTLFKNDGATVINNNDFITVAEGGAGLKFTPASNLNSGAGDTFSFSVQSSRDAIGTGLSAGSAAATITVNAVNDVPSFTKGGDQTVLANSGAQTVNGWATALSAGPANESGQVLDFIVNNNNNTLFSAQPAVSATGVLTYTPANNQNGTAVVTVQIHDNGGTLFGGVDTSATQTFNIAVNQSGTTTTLASDHNPSFTNQLVTFTATVTSNTAVVGPPTGTVQFFDGVTPLTCSNGSTSTEPVDGTGKAICQTSTLTSAGSPHSINATYSGDGAFSGSSSNTVSQNITPQLSLTVNDTGDTPDAALNGICADVNGKCTLRAAIEETNFAASDDTINFSLPANSTINLSTALPNIIGNVSINGPGADTLIVRRSTAGGTPNFTVFQIGSPFIVTISGMTVSNGNSNGVAGGIRNDGTLTLSGLTISGNTALADGGGIANLGTLTINGSTISGNTAGNGAGLSNAAPGSGFTASATINNSTISGNAGQQAGGIRNFAPSGGTANLTLTNVTVSNNTTTNAASGAGITINGPGTVTLRNTIVAGNLRSSTASDINGTVDPTSSFNVIGTGGSGGLTNGVNNNIVGVANARLAPLANNGGRTQTMALLSGSPALDAGSNTLATNAGLTTDQRGAGFNRFIDGVDADAIAQVDVGAFEAQPAIEDITDKSTNEDTALPSFNFTVADGGVSNFTVTATSSDTTLVPNGNINVGGAGSTRSLSITPAANQNGTTTISVTAAGTIGTTPVSMTDTFVLTVNAVNDAPSFALAAGPIVNEDSGPQTIANQAVNINAGPANESGQTLAFTVSNNNNGLFSVQPAISPTGTLTFTSAPDANGSATVSVTLKDNGGTANGGSDTSTTQQFTITVNAVNDAPVNTVPGATQQVTENSTLTFSTANANAISIADIDAGGGAMRETLTATNGTLTLGSTAGLAFTVGNGTANSTMTFTGTIAAVNTALQGMTFTPTNGFSGAATLTIVTNDQGNTGSGGALSDTDVVNINVNDGGTLQLSAATYTVGENSGPAVITITRTGGSAGTATVKIDTSNGTATAGSDYTAVSQTVTFNNGETSKTVNIPISDDLLNEPDETVNITLSNAGGSGALGTPATAVLTITNDDPAGGYIKFSTANYNVNEGGVATITVQRTGTLTQAVTIDFATTDNSDPASFVPCAPTPGNTLATSRCDFDSAFGRISFAAGDGADKTFTVMTQQDYYVEGPETLTLTLSNPTGGAGILGLPTATLTINDDASEPAGNAVDDTANFVESLYRDFLNRVSDPAGKAFWIANIDKCNSAATRPPNLTQAECIAAFRVSTAQAFFLSGEYQQTGGTAYLTNRVAFGSLPNFIRFEKDAQMLGKGYVFGAPGADAVLEANKVAYFNDYVSRTEFVNTYGAVSNQQYVETLTQNTGVPWGVGEKQQLVDGLNNATETRATVLRKITEKPEFRNAERESMFVLTEYFGFLRRNPDQPGFNFWLNKLHSANGNAMQAEMVRAFVESPEYRQRFGQ